MLLGNATLWLALVLFKTSDSCWSTSNGEVRTEVGAVKQVLVKGKNYKMVVNYR